MPAPDIIIEAKALDEPLDSDFDTFRRYVQSINTPGFRAVQGRLTDEAGI